MFQLLYKYLILHKQANLPGLGVFHIERVPPQLDFSNKVFTPPAFAITFKAGAPVVDERFYAFISREQKMEESEAKRIFNDFSYSLSKELDNKKSVQVNEIGQLFINENGQLQLQTSQRLNNYFPAVSTERVALTEPVKSIPETNTNVTDLAEETAVTTEEPAAIKKDYWWIAAIIIAIIAIGSICYYYYANGSLQ